MGVTTFTATREATTLNWEEYGFTLHIPEGALPPDVELCHIHVKSSIHGHYQLPDDHELVSSVFWIMCHHKLSKPATMEIEHCAAVTTHDQCSALTFVRSHCTQEKLPYTFVPFPEGVFTPGSSFGSICLSRFSGIGIASRKRPKRVSHAPPEKRLRLPESHVMEDDSDSFPQERYCAQLYSATKEVNMWKVYFVLTKDLKAYKKVCICNFA